MNKVFEVFEIIYKFLILLEMHIVYLLTGSFLITDIFILLITQANAYLETSSSTKNFISILGYKIKWNVKNNTQ